MWCSINVPQVLMGFVYGRPALKSCKRNKCVFCFMEVHMAILLASQPWGQVYFIRGTSIHSNLPSATLVLAFLPLDSLAFLLIPGSDDPVVLNVPCRGLAPEDGLLMKFARHIFYKLVSILAFV